MVLEWVLDRQPSGDAGVLVYIRVDDVDASLETISEAGGEIVLPRTDEGEGPAYATFGTRPETSSESFKKAASRGAGGQARGLFGSEPFPPSVDFLLPSADLERPAIERKCSILVRCGYRPGRPSEKLESLEEVCRDSAVAEAFIETVCASPIQRAGGFDAGTLGLSRGCFRRFHEHLADAVAMVRLVDHEGCDPALRAPVVRHWYEEVDCGPNERPAVVGDDHVSPRIGEHVFEPPAKVPLRSADGLSGRTGERAHRHPPAEPSELPLPSSPPEYERVPESAPLRLMPPAGASRCHSASRSLPSAVRRRDRARGPHTGCGV